MFRIGNVLGITKYFLLSALTLSSECLAAVNKVQNDDSHKELYLKSSSSRSLLYSWDDDTKPKYRYNYSSDNSEKVVYILVSTFIFIIAITCRCCLKYGCSDGESNNYTDTVVHPPPRISGTVAPPSSSYSGMTTRSGNVLAPPRTSSSIILPFEADAFPAHLYGIDNPNYEPASSSSGQYYSPVIQNQTPLCDILDMPPSYDTVVKEDMKYPKPKGNN